MRRALVAALALSIAAPAAAQIQEKPGPSPRWGSLDIAFGQYKPDIDSEFPTKPGPYELMFGNNAGWIVTATVSYTLFARYGTIDAGFKSGYFSKEGNGLIEDPNAPGGFSRAGAKSALKIVPTSAVLTYRFDWPVERHDIPVAPYVRLAFERYNWWVTRGTGGTVEKGATMGWSAAGGIALLADVLDPQLAREFDRESGVNHTYFFFEVVRAKIDDFGSSKSWDFSSKGFTWNAGMTLVF